MRRLEVKSKMARRLVVALAGALALMFMLRQCSSERPMGSAAVQQARAGGDTLNVAVEYSPMSLMMTGDTLGGFGYDMIREIASRQNLAVRFTPVTSLSATLRALAADRYDVVIAEIPVTAEFRERYRYTEPVCLDRMVLVQRADSAGRVEVNTQLDLARRRVTVIAGTPASDRLRNLSHEIGDTIIVEADSIHSSEQLFMLTASGEIGASVINSATARVLSDGRADVDATRGVSFTQFQSWIVGKRRAAVADSVDSGIVRFKRTAAYRDLVRRYGLMPAL